jgi:hypothetical protein
MSLLVLFTLLGFQDTGVDESPIGLPQDSAEETELPAALQPLVKTTTEQQLQRVETQSKQTLLLLRALQEKIEEEEAAAPESETLIESTEEPVLMFPLTPASLAVEPGDFQ